MNNNPNKEQIEKDLESAIADLHNAQFHFDIALQHVRHALSEAEGDVVLTRKIGHLESSALTRKNETNILIRHLHTLLGIPEVFDSGC